LGEPALLGSVLSPEGWLYASAPPTGPGDPGRYHTLFGRDSLIAALQLLPVRPDVAEATLRALAALQGARDDPETDEEPGKIVHEHWRRVPRRLVDMGWPVRDGGLRYYGSADSTSWFLVVLGALGDGRLAAELEGSWRAAGEWLERTVARGGGLVRHGPRLARGGLGQQGWRDATDPLDPDMHGGGILREDGSVPEPPLADADSQAVAVAAARALAGLSGEQRHRELAASLRGEVVRAFGGAAGGGHGGDGSRSTFQPHSGGKVDLTSETPGGTGRGLPETLAVEGGGRLVRGAGSQLGWLLWADAAPDGAAERLTSPDVLTPWGLRTLSADHPAFHLHAYHRGGIWPFDCWLGWGGLRAAGHEEEAERLRTGVLEALDRLGGAPELYAAGADGPEPVAISNRVQAWTVGARWALENRWDGRAEV
jgi:glycogen debranching enzyme